MVAEWGMSAMGPVNLWTRFFSGRVWTDWILSRKCSLPSNAGKIDNEIKSIMDNALKNAEGIIKKHKAMLDSVAKSLLDKETLDRDEFEKIVGKKSKLHF